MNSETTTYRRLGDYIRQVDDRNSNGEITLSQGICNQKYFQDPKQVSSTPHLDKIVRTGQFAYNRATTRNGNKISIALREGPDCTVSSAYCVFVITDENVIDPHWLWLWFKRPEFDRYAIFKSHGSAHEFFEFETMSNVVLPVPPIEEQREIVARHKAIEHKIDVNRRLIAKLEETARTIYRHTFVENIDPENLPDGWRLGTLGDFIISFSKSHKFDKEKLIFLNTSDVYDGEILTSDYTDISTLPGQAKKSISKGDILFSEIRPANKRNAIVRTDADDYVVSTKLMVLRRKSEELSLYRIYNYLTLPETLEDLQGLADGDSGTFPQITFEGYLQNRTVIIGDETTEIQFQLALDSIYKSIFTLKDEITSLNKII